MIFGIFCQKKTEDIWYLFLG